MKSAVDPQTPLKVVKSQLDNWWPVWQEELQKLGLTCIRGGFDAELNGTAATFRAGLDHLWNYFEPILARNGDRFAERTTLDARLRAALRIADAICGGLFGDRYWGGLTDCVLPEIDPDRGWTGARTKLVATGLQGILPDQEFSEFAGVFFRTVVQVLRQRALEVGDIYVKRACDIPPSSWELLRASGIASGLRVNIALKRLYRSGDNVPVEGPISAFIDALEGAWKFAADLLRRRMSAGSRFLMADVPTYGIFAPNNATDADVQLADKAREWGVPLALFLPSTDRVLLCAEALDDFRAVLNKSGDGLNAARLFLRSVLVHEHFHAFARTAPMDDGSPPPGPGFQSHWTDALPVNEAIAAWMQVHFARDEADLRERIWDYIKSGSYPQWPYAGAALIEEAYTEKGLDAVRSLIHLLRIDPPRASAWMREKAAAIGTVLNQGKAEIAPDMQ